MRKILPILLAATVYLTPLYPVYAQSNTVSSTPSLRSATGSAVTGAPAMLGSEGNGSAISGRDKVASKAAALKERLTKFKDKNKASRAEKISNNLNRINQKWTAEMSNNLQRMSKILDKLKARAQEAEAAGKDVTELNAAVANFETQWAEADSALNSQMEVDYSIAVNTESTVKADATTARNTLQTDLKSTHTQITEARQALGSAIKAALGVFGGNNGQ